MQLLNTSAILKTCWLRQFVTKVGIYLLIMSSFHNQNLFFFQLKFGTVVPALHDLLFSPYHHHHHLHNHLSHLPSLFNSRLKNVPVSPVLLIVHFLPPTKLLSWVY